MKAVSLAAKCPTCGATAIVKKESPFLGNKLVKTLACGHTFFEERAAFPTGRDAIWNLLMPYQQKGVEFLEAANFNALLADEMGLGKTIQTLAALRYNWADLTPALVVCKSSLIFNWVREFHNWVAKDNPALKPFERFAYVHFDGQSGLLPMPVVVTSMDLLHKPKVADSINELAFKTIIVDESHNFSNINSKRTGALFELARSIKHRILLSGTPFANNFVEYFPSLHLIKPDHWPNRKYFMRRWAEFDSQTRKWLGLQPHRRQEFFEVTSPYILRRERKEVYKDLPPLQRNTKVLGVYEQNFVSAYNKKLDELEEELEARRHSGPKSTYILGIMAELRHLCGLAKIKPAVEYINEFLENTDGKLTIGMHHKDIRFWLKKGLEQWNPLEMAGEHSPEQKEKIQETFRTSKEHRLLLANITAAGEGRNFQFCPNAILIERNWTAKTEEQFELRFSRPMKCEKDNSLLQRWSQDRGFWECPTCFDKSEVLPVQIDYLVAAGTIDEFFNEIVELKRRVFGSVMDYNLEADPESIYKLAERAVQARLKVVGI